MEIRQDMAVALLLLTYSRQPCFDLPPLVVLRTELYICGDNGDLNGDDDRQCTHHKAEAKDVVEIPLYIQQNRLRQIRTYHKRWHWHHPGPVEA